MKRERLCLTLLLVAMVFVVSCTSLPLSEYLNSDAEWTMVIESLDDPQQSVTIKNSDATTIAEQKGHTLHYENLGGRDIDLTLAFVNSKTCDGGVEILATIANNEQGWMVRSFEGPSLTGLKAGVEDAVLIPLGTGFRISIKESLAIAEKIKNGEEPETLLNKRLKWAWNSEKSHFECSLAYPSQYCTMQWCALQGKCGGIYVASHDEKFSYKYMNVSFDPSNSNLHIGFCNMLECFPGEKVEVAPVVYKPYKGEWYECSDTYRKWYSSHRTIAERPEWVKNCRGWLLAILKQQNDEVIVPYEEIGGLLADAAEERGIDILGLFGRGIGGHDRFYPDYRPDPKMGGEAAIKKGIAEAKAKGKRVVLYTNGQLLDMNETPQFWPDTGKVISVRQRDGELWQLTYHKYDSAPARHFGLACHSCDTWREIMLRLAKDANDLGADGILYDQLAVFSPAYCYNPNHGHRVPAIVYGADRLDNMNYVQREMSKINPEFVVMTEGLIDYELNSVGMFHGYCRGAIVPAKSDFKDRFEDKGAVQYHTEMFHYTFPENVMTMRMASPSNSRFSMNYNLAFGFRNEVELRYAADREYFASNKVPTIDDYVNVRRASSEDTVKRIEEAGEPVASIKYYKQTILFQQKHSELIMHGKYLAGNGVKLNASSPYVMANAWKSHDGKKLGILVWNISDEEVTYDVAYKGYKAIAICVPDKEDVKLGDKLDAQSLHLVIFEK
jgi:hypothetical protein